MSNAGTELHAIADRHYVDDGTRKAISYWIEYEQLLRTRRHNPLRILELGVFSGASLLVWRDYLPRATIVGVDIGEAPACIAGKSRIHFIRASQDDQAALALAGERAGGPFDLIIDDASHIGYLTKRSFACLFPRWLAPGGHYVIEDFGTGFLPEFPDGAQFVEPPADDAHAETRQFKSHQYGMVGVIKQLLDCMMQELMTGSKPPLDIERVILRPNLAIFAKASR